MGDGGGDIIIKGGSCEIYFDHNAYEKDESDPQKRKHRTLNIKQVTITGDQYFRDYDTGEHPEGFKGTIRIVCR